MLRYAGELCSAYWLIDPLHWNGAIINVTTYTCIFSAIIIQNVHGERILTLKRGEMYDT